MDWDQIYLTGKIIKRSKKNPKRGKSKSTYRSIRFSIDGNGNKATMGYAKVVWNCFHPDDPVREGEAIHHIDLNSLNDCPENYMKMSWRNHSKLHGKIDRIRAKVTWPKNKWREAIPIITEKFKNKGRRCV